jgi:hypothetical protein
VANDITRDSTRLEDIRIHARFKLAALWTTSRWLRAERTR